MFRYIQFMVVRSLAVACVNRDETGNPKSAWFGGVKRGRVSSQSVKHAIRVAFLETLGRALVGTRSKYLSGAVADIMVSAGRDRADAAAVAEGAFAAVGFPLDEDGRTQALTHLSHSELQGVADACLLPANWDPLLAYGRTIAAGRTAAEEKRAAAKEARAKAKAAGDELPDVDEALGDADATTDEKRGKKSALRGGVDKAVSKSILAAIGDAAKRPSIDIAMFGRFIADRPEFTSDGACEFGHCLTSSETITEIEFFSGGDDIGSVRGDVEHLGENKFAGGVYCQPVNVNLDALLAAVNGDRGLAERAVGALAAAIIETFPKGRQATMSAPTLPQFVLAEARRLPMSHMNAWERPVSASGKGLLTPTLFALDRHVKEMNEVYGAPSEAVWFAVGDVEMKNIGTRVKGVDAIVDAVKRMTTSRYSQEKKQ